jgi:hypothetical protein
MDTTEDRLARLRQRDAKLAAELERVPMHLKGSPWELDRIACREQTARKIAELVEGAALAEAAGNRGGPGPEDAVTAPPWTARLVPRKTAQTQQSRHQGQTGGPAFRRMGKRPSAGGQTEGSGTSDDLESGVISYRQTQRRNLRESNQRSTHASPTQFHSFGIATLPLVAGVLG